ncbi:hypothetical protein MTR_8g064280 [Medicago truncatula]|uniref:Uncharacterized protein n=1 Tax=Medicago truncatula TaxID=3880 RepID=A0A072U2H5_MEDTR|nr:hypothetical protein MTR_8g064280 [Medicago truncatula]
MFGIKRTISILTIIGNGGNSGTRELNNQDGKKNEEEFARYVCYRFSIYSIVIINYLTTKKNQVIMEITAILTIFEIMTILTKIEKCGSWERQN